MTVGDGAAETAGERRYAAAVCLQYDLAAIIDGCADTVGADSWFAHRETSVRQVYHQRNMCDSE